jgi:thiamine biosynthesis lipoprotein ApbE
MPQLRVPAIFVAIGLMLTGNAAADDYALFHENVMGTSLELRVRAESESAARGAEARVLVEIARLTGIFSGYDPASEFSRWQSGPQRRGGVSPELFDLLRACDRWRSLSGGAFEPRIEGLTRLWKRSAAEGRMPTADEIGVVRYRMSGPPWRLHPEDRSAERLGDAPMTLNAIAKGYIVGRACDAAQAERGVRGRPGARVERGGRPACRRGFLATDRDRIPAG